MIIPFRKKFCEQDLEYTVKSYWIESFKSENLSITFDLSCLEWINIEEIGFLFAWIRSLKNLERELLIILPYTSEIQTSKTITKETMSLFKSEILQDNYDSIERRRRLNLFLLSIWGMLSNLGLKDTNFTNIIEAYNLKAEQIRKSSFSHQVIPFTVLDASHKAGQRIIIDRTFEKAIQTRNISMFKSSEGNSADVFELSKEITELLIKYSCYSPFESSIISYVITKELFINAAEHSGKSESYFVIGLLNRWENPHSQSFLDRFTKEKEKNTQDFFKDKSIIYNQLLGNKKDLSIELKNSLCYNELNLSSYNSSFRNLSFLEFSYIDFGIGIYKTLKEEYYKQLESVLNLLSDFHNSKHEHSRILEFAFLMESSKNPYDRDIEYSELIPRGLYFVVDMVRRFKGLLIARSGYGKVIFDFSDKIYINENNDKLSVGIDRVYQIREAVRNLEENTIFMEGTMISIILPERSTEHLKRSSVRIDNKKLNQFIYNKNLDIDFPKLIFKPESFHYISLSFIYQEAIEVLSADELNIKTTLDNFIFKSIDEKLNELKGQNCLLFIDFEFLSERENFLKIIIWLTNTPKINEFTKVIIVNLTETESKIITQYKEKTLNVSILNRTDFLFKPIPCIRLTNHTNLNINKNDITWIGILDSNDEALLTNLLLGNKENYPRSFFSKQWITEGNITSDYQENVYSVFDSFNNLLSEFIEAKKRYLNFWILNHTIKDGTKPKNSEKSHVFLTSRGSYQFRYISLYETLHNKYIARSFGKYLLDSYINSNKNNGVLDEELRFNKIIVVTVSSQLIGVAIRDLIRDYNEYKFLRINPKDNNQLINSPKLIRLASYFSFDTEKPFEEIEENDSVVIVNDVISTGSLVNRLLVGINKKKAITKSIMSIVDCRFNIQLKSQHQDVQPVHLGIDNEKLVTSILTSEANPSFYLEKMMQKPSGDYEIKRINPILNTVVELKYEHSEKVRVLYENAESFFKESFSRNEIFKIGHFKQNLTHNSFYTDMGLLFQDENGILVLKKLKNGIENLSDRLKISKSEATLTNLINAQNYLKNILDKNILKLIYNERLIEIISELDEIKTSIQSNELELVDNQLYNPDFIFHPVFSGIEEVSDRLFSTIFGTHIDNIIGLQRYDTRNGWRFPFPAKRYNKLTKGKHILIIDSGSLTGDSLIQLIDSISFLEVGRIDFLSIIGRIEDFQREFYSRLKSIKVKNIRHGDEQKKQIQTIVNLNLLFGINLHIPPYSIGNCPFCHEVRLLKSYIERSDIRELPQNAYLYINHRLENEIKLIENRNSSFIPSYIPICQDSQDYPVDTKSIFLMRDRLGKVDSYRFYHEYFTFFDEIVDKVETNVYDDKNNLKNFELILICILHEPSLFGVHKDLLVNVYNITKKIISDLIIDNLINLSNLFYVWSRYAFVRLFFIFWEHLAYSTENFEHLFEFSKEDPSSINYLSFILFEPFISKRENYDQNKSIQIISTMSKSFDNNESYNLNHIYRNNYIRRIIKDIILTFEPVKTEDVNQAFYNLFLFFNVVHNSQHNKLLKEQISFLSTIINNENPEEFIEIKHISSEIVNIINETLYDNLKTIKHSKIAISNKWPCNDFLFGDLSITNILRKLNKEFEDLNQTDNISINSEKLIRSKAFLSILVNELQPKYLLKDTQFYNFCLNYYTDLKFDCLDKVIVNPDFIKVKNERNNFIVSKFNKRDLLVQGHKEYLYYAFLEIFINSAKREANDDTTISFRVKKDIETGIIDFTIHQNKPFIKYDENYSGGINKIIIPIFESFCGKGNISLITNDPNYFEINIKFNCNKLNIERNGK